MARYVRDTMTREERALLRSRGITRRWWTHDGLVTERHGIRGGEQLW